VAALSEWFELRRKVRDRLLGAGGSERNRIMGIIVRRCGTVYEINGRALGLDEAVDYIVANGSPDLRVRKRRRASEQRARNASLSLHDLQD